MARAKKDVVFLDAGKVPPPIKTLPTFIINDIEFIDISNESYRTYEFNNGRILTIYEPKGINISESRGHRIVTKDGWCVYVKPAEGWFIHWRNYDASKPFIF